LVSHPGAAEQVCNGLFDLTGRVALVTGSSRGIGLTLARGLAQAGATIVLNGVDVARLERAVADCRAAGYAAHAAAFDVTNPDAVGEAIAHVEEAVGPIEILVNNAGLQIRHPLQDFPIQDWNTLMAVNVGGVFLVSQAVARRMIGRGHGKIISIGSMQSELARPSIAPYTASKGAVKNLVKGMCTEWAKYGIQSNGIGPGYFATEMTQALVDNPEFDAWLRNRTPAQRWGDVKELIGAVVFLASDASSFVNGHMLYVDGGMLACV
jgi:gluconate 5-dehydrogenase